MVKTSRTAIMTYTIIGKALEIEITILSAPSPGIPPEGNWTAMFPVIGL